MNRMEFESIGVRILPSKCQISRHCELIPASIHAGIHEFGIPEEKMRQSLGKPLYKGETENKFKSLVFEFENMLTYGASTFLASCEKLIWLNEIQIATLDRFLSQFFEDRIYMIYIRNTIDYYISRYSQKLYNNSLPGWMNLEEFLKYCINETFAGDRINYWDQVFLWKNIFGDSFFVRLLESDWLVKNDLIEDFSSFIGIPSYCKPSNQNESFAAEYIEYVMKINKTFGHKIPLTTRRKAFNFLQNSSRGKPKLSVSDELAHSVQKKTHDQEERIRYKFFPERKRLFAKKHRNPVVAPIPLTKKRMAAIDVEIQKAIYPTNWDRFKLTQSAEG